MAGLSELDKRILAFEQSWWQFPGAKEREILEVFGMPVTRYYQLLNALIDRPEASEFDAERAIRAGLGLIFAVPKVRVAILNPNRGKVS